MDDRKQRYQALVDARKACRLCSDMGLVNGSVIRGGELDSAAIGPWSAVSGDLHARVVVVGQDWGDQQAFEKQAGRDLPHNATNQMLRSLMAAAKIIAPEASLDDASGVFLTNAVLCFKTGGCQGPVKSRWFENCGRHFLRPQIELINPRAVVCLGERAYRTVLDCYKLPSPRSWRTAVEGAGATLPGGSILFAVYHCGRRILNTHRSADAQLQDWERIGAVLAKVGRAAEGLT